MSKIFVFYHKSCSDGSAAAAVVYQHIYLTSLKAGHIKCGENPGNVEWVPVQYNRFNTVEEFAKKFDIVDNQVIVVDFSFNDEIHDHILNNANYYIWLDHHKTALQAQYKRVGMEYVNAFHSEDTNHAFALDEAYSGAMLAWDFFNNQDQARWNPPKLIKHVQDRDLWQFELEGTKELACYLSANTLSMGQWVELLENDDKVQECIVEGAAILKVYDTQTARLVKKAIPVVIDDHKGLIVNSTMHQSEIGNQLAKQSGTFGAIWFYGEGKAIVGLRSIGDFDVSVIAKKFGGGGHKNASGFSISLSFLNAMFEYTDAILKGEYAAQFAPDEQYGGYVITFRDVPEATTQADTIEEAIVMAKDALKTALGFYLENGLRMPFATKALPSECIISLD